MVREARGLLHWFEIVVAAFVEWEEGTVLCRVSEFQFRRFDVLQEPGLDLRQCNLMPIF